MVKTAAPTRVTLDIDAEDMKILAGIKNSIEKSIGRVSMAAAIRAAIRMAATSTVAK